MVTDQIEKAVNPSGFKAAWSLGRSQRAIRNQATRSAWGETRSSIKAMKSAKTPDEINNIQSASQKKINEIGRDYVQGRSILRADQKKLNPAARVASNVAQYPLRWSAGTATAGATGYGVNRKVKKNEDIDKAAKKPTEKQKNAMLKGALVGGGVGTLVLPGLGTAGGAYIGYRHQGKKVGVYKSDNMSAFGVEHSEISKKKEVSKAVNPFKAKKQVAAQMELLDSVGNKYLKKTPNFNPQGVLHGSPRLSGPKKAGDSVKQVQLNIAGAQARRKVNGQ